MCGITGFLALKEQSSLKDLLQEMVSQLHHRGPDDQGIWAENYVFLGHARLSIHDLSWAGHQPMTSHCGRCVLVFNGEIYNYLELKAELEREFSQSFTSNSDTEVLVNAIACWGIEQTLARLVGMFAFALWDR